MRHRIAFVMLLSLCAFTFAQNHASESKLRPVTLMPGVGTVHHPVSTSNSEAQKFFDQGLRLIYAFNHDEAARSFQHATELDPKLALAYWGIAEAVGPNYNDPASDDRFLAGASGHSKSRGPGQRLAQRAGIYPRHGSSLSRGSQR